MLGLIRNYLLNNYLSVLNFYRHLFVTLRTMYFYIRAVASL